jgi:hypothetical protein
MTDQKNCDTSVVIVRAACGHVCARCRYDLLLRNKGYWVGLAYFHGRRHHSIEEIYGCLGERYIRQAYRMLYQSFWLLHGNLSPRIAKAVDNSRCYKQKGGRGGKYKLSPMRNGPVSTSVRLACALQYFAGALQYDIMAKYGISEKSVRESI